MNGMKKLANYSKLGASYYKRNGARLTVGRLFLGVGTHLSSPKNAGGLRGRRNASLVKFEDAAVADWTVDPQWKQEPRSVGDGPFTTAWIMSPPGEHSGGHQNIFRFLSFLEQAGHTVKIFLYSSNPLPINIKGIQKILRASVAYPQLNASIEVYSPSAGVGEEVDAIFSTGWETAYPSYLDRSNARRYYFVQDFEPSFYSVGSESVLAENTYRFGFEAFTAGRWLAKKLSTDYGMKTHPFDFAADFSLYKRTNEQRRSDVFFYARPVTARRGFELGVMTLAEVKRLRPLTTIHMAGWRLGGWDVPFDFIDHGAMSISDLSPLYNKCAAALVMSLTNMSLLPLELLSCGTIPVVNDAENNRLVSDNPHIAYTPLSPKALAHRIVEILDDSQQIEKSCEAASSVSDFSWDDAGAQFVAAFEEAMRG